MRLRGTTLRILLAIDDHPPVEVATQDMTLHARRLPAGTQGVAGVTVRVGKRGLRREVRRALRRLARTL